jgi:hypothetical protein
MLFGKQFDKDKFEEFLRLIYATPAFVAQYSSFQEADQMIQRILASDHSAGNLDH